MPPNANGLEVTDPWSTSLYRLGVHCKGILGSSPPSLQRLANPVLEKNIAGIQHLWRLHEAALQDCLFQVGIYWVCR